MQKIYGAILAIIGAVDLFYGIEKISSGFGKLSAKNGNFQDITIVLIVSGIGFLILGILKFLEK